MCLEALGPRQRSNCRSQHRQRFGMGPDEALGGACRFAHDIAELAGQAHAVTAGQEAGLHIENFAAGLGPTRTGVDSGTPFPANPLAVVNSPVEVTVNGKLAEVLGAVGFPGSVEGYQVNFRVPPGTAKGVATIQVSAAWIAGTAVGIAVQ